MNAVVTVASFNVIQVTGAIIAQGTVTSTTIGQFS